MFMEFNQFQIREFRHFLISQLAEHFAEVFLDINFQNESFWIRSFKFQSIDLSQTIIFIILKKNIFILH